MSVRSRFQVPPQVMLRNLIQGLTTGETVSRGLSAEDETRKLPKIEEIVNLAAIL